MQSTRDWERLYQAVAHIERRAIDTWRKEYYPQLGIEAAICEWLTMIETTTQQTRGGNISVTVCLVARLAHQSRVDLYYLQRSGNRYYEKVDPL